MIRGVPVMTNQRRDTDDEDDVETLDDIIDRYAQ